MISCNDAIRQDWLCFISAIVHVIRSLLCLIQLIGHPMSSLAKSLRYSISRFDLNQQSVVCIIRLLVRVNSIVFVYFSKRKV